MATINGGSSLGPQTYPNLLVNPGFEVWQRGSGPFTANGSWAGDRWQASLGSGSAVSVQRDTANVDAGSAACAAVTYTQGTGNSQLVQPINGDQPQLFGRTVTFTMRVKCSTANAVQIYVYDTVSGNRFGTTHPGDGTYHTLVVTALVAATATTVQVGVNLTASCTLYADNAVLVVGSQPIPYVPLHPADDLARCQRYYERLADDGSARLVWGGWSGGSGQTFYQAVPFRVRKAVTPTITVTGAWGGFGANIPPTVSGADTGMVALQYVSNASNVLTYVNSANGGNVVAEANP